MSSEVKFVRDIDPNRGWLDQKLWSIGSLYLLTRSVSFGRALYNPIAIYSSTGQGVVLTDPLIMIYADTHEEAIKSYCRSGTKIQGMISKACTIDEV